MNTESNKTEDMSTESNKTEDMSKKRKTKRKFRGFEFDPEKIAPSMKKKIKEYERINP
jgi:hypothetical protein